MKRIINRLQHYSLNKNIRVAFILVFLALVILENPWFGQPQLKRVANTGMIDMNIFITPNEISSILHTMGNEGRALYANLLAIDLLVILTFTNLLVISFFKLKPKPTLSGNIDYLVLIPILRAVADLIENTFLYLSTAGFPSLILGLLGATSMIITIKWVLLALTGLVFIYLLTLRRGERANEQI